MKIVCFYSSFILIKKFFKGKRVALFSIPDSPKSVVLILYDVDFGERRITVSEIKVLDSRCDSDEEGGDKIEIRDVKDSPTVLLYSGFISKFISSFIDYFMRKGFEVWISKWITHWFILIYVIVQHTRSELNNGILFRKKLA